MYATPVVDGNTVVPVVIPPRSMTQRDRLGSSPRASNSRSTSTRAPSMSTSTALIAFILSPNLRQENGPGIRRSRSLSSSAKPLLNRDGDLHAEGEVGRAIALVRSFRRVGERNFVRLVRLREERARQVVHGVLHAGVESRRATRGNGIRPERDVVRSTRDIGEAHGRAGRNRDGSGLERGARAALTRH